MWAVQAEQMKYFKIWTFFSFLEAYDLMRNSDLFKMCDKVSYQNITYERSNDTKPFAINKNNRLWLFPNHTNTRDIKIYNFVTRWINVFTNQPKLLALLSNLITHTPCPSNHACQSRRWLGLRSYTLTPFQHHRALP